MHWLRGKIGLHSYLIQVIFHQLSCLPLCFLTERKFWNQLNLPTCKQLWESTSSFLNREIRCARRETSVAYFFPSSKLSTGHQSWIFPGILPKQGVKCAAVDLPIGGFLYLHILISHLNTARRKCKLCVFTSSVIVADIRGFWLNGLCISNRTPAY